VLLFDALSAVMEPIWGNIQNEFSWVWMSSTYAILNPHLTDYPKKDSCEVLTCVRAFDVPEGKETRPQY
jgi:hypothetical protein